MSEIVSKKQTETPFDEEYRQWIQQLCQRYRQSQIKAAVKVNDEMLRFYWSVGKDIEQKQYANRYGSHFFEQVSSDLQHNLGIKKGLAPTSIRYTHRFYLLYSPLFGILQQPAEELKNQPNLRQLAEQFGQLFMIPWSHHHTICTLDNQDTSQHSRIQSSKTAASTGTSIQTPIRRRDRSQTQIKIEIEDR